MIKIGVLNSKGGVGKTTLSTNLAVRAGLSAPRIALVDLDPNKGSRKWYDIRSKHTQPEALGAPQPPPEVLSGVSNPVAVLDRLKDGWDMAILDGAPGTLTATRQLIEACDVIIVPERTSRDDKERTVAIVEECRRKGTPVVVVVNEILLKSQDVKRHDKAMGLVDDIKSTGATVLYTVSRSSYETALDAGYGVHEITGEGSSKARGEIDAIFEAAIKAATDEVAA